MEKQILRFYGFKFIVCNIYRFVQAVLSLIPLLEQVSFRAVFLIIYFNVFRCRSCWFGCAILLKLPDQICPSPYCQLYNFYDFSLENLASDQLIIPKLIFFFILITYLVVIVSIL